VSELDAAERAFFDRHGHAIDTHEELRAAMYRAGIPRDESGRFRRRHVEDALAARAAAPPVCEHGI
jgi:hypothetical protein